MRKLIVVLALVVGLWPAAAFAQAPDGNGSGTRIQIDADAVVEQDERLGTLIVINGDAVVDGEVLDNVFVVNGDALISGAVNGDVTVISGDVHLMDGSTVDDVISVRGSVQQDSGATVNGDIEETEVAWWWWALIGAASVVLWLGVTAALLVAGVIFAMIAGSQLRRSTQVMTGEPVNAFLGTVWLWIGVPLIAGVAMVTVVGLPLGLGILVFLLPVLGFLGYLVAAARVGAYLVGLLNQDDADRPVLAVILGVLLFQFVLFIPFFGALAVAIVSLWGAGSLAIVAYRGVQISRAEREASSAPVPEETPVAAGTQAAAETAPLPAEPEAAATQTPSEEPPEEPETPPEVEPPSDTDGSPEQADAESRPDRND